jgi:hypothetical protein
MQSIDFKKFLPHIYIIVAFLLIAFLYNYPVLQGKTLSQHDNVSWKGMAHEGMEWHEKTGENVLWSNSMFGGMPSYTFFVGKSNNYFRYVQSFVDLLAKPVNYIFIALLCFYILLCTLRMNRLLAAVGAFAFAFSTYNLIIIGAGHDSKMITLAYIPLVISALLVLYRGKYLMGGIYLAIAWALFIVASHLQIIYYTLLVILLMVLGLFIKAIKEQKVKEFFISSVIALAAFAIGVGPGMSNLMTVREYSEATMRGGKSELTMNHDKSKSSGGLDKDYAFQWSNGIGEAFCVLVPYLYGGSSHEPVTVAPKAGEILSNAGYSAVPLYWGPQPFLSGPVYFGAIICFLFVLGLFVVRSPHKWWIVAACIIGFILSFGKNLPSINYYLFDHLPFYNKFRTPSMALVIPEFLFPLLGMWAVWEIINGDVTKEDAWKKIKIAAGIAAGLCLLLAIGGSMFFDFTNAAADANYPAELLKALKEDRSSVAMSSAIKSAVLILLSAGLLWAFIKDKIKVNMLIGGLALLMVIDLLPVAYRYLNDANFEDESDYSATFEPRQVDKQIMQDSDPYYRVLDLSRDTYNDAIQSYFHKSIGGYSPAKLESYQDMIDMQMNRQTGFNAQVLNMLNTKYIIIPTGKQGEAQIAEKNPDACGNAWFVSNIKWAKNADEEMQSLNANKLGDTVKVANAFEPKREAVVNEKYKTELGSYTFGKDSSAKISLAKYGLDDLSFQSSNSQAGLGVFSDIFYDKGWEAYVDDKQTPIIKADYLLRAIQIPAGNHKIEFHFRPKTYEMGERIALISSLLLYALGILAIVILLKNKQEDVKG